MIQLNPHQRRMNRFWRFVHLFRLGIVVAIGLVIFVGLLGLVAWSYNLIYSE